MAVPLEVIVDYILKDFLTALNLKLHSCYLNKKQRFEYTCMAFCIDLDVAPYFNDLVYLTQLVQKIWCFYHITIVNDFIKIRHLATLL